MLYYLVMQGGPALLDLTYFTNGFFDSVGMLGYSIFLSKY